MGCVWVCVRVNDLRICVCLFAQYLGNTPLHFCYMFGYGETLGQYLLSKGADDSLRNSDACLCYDLSP